MEPKMNYGQPLKWLTLIITWLAVSPLFLYLSYRWKMLRKWLRWVLTFISPLFLILYLIIFVFLTFWLEDSKINPYRDDNYFSNEKRLERITGVKFDIRKVIDFEKGSKGFTGDYSSEITILLKQQPDYQVLDSLVREEKWSKYEDVYCFHRIWGNEIEPPEGENKNEDRFLTVRVVPNSDTLYVTSGAW